MIQTLREYAYPKGVKVDTVEHTSRKQIARLYFKYTTVDVTHDRDNVWGWQGYSVDIYENNRLVDIAECDTFDKVINILDCLSI